MSWQRSWGGSNTCQWFSTSLFSPGQQYPIYIYFEGDVEWNKNQSWILHLCMQRAELDCGLLFCNLGAHLALAPGASLRLSCLSELFCHHCSVEFWLLQRWEQSLPFCFILRASMGQLCLDCWEVLSMQIWPPVIGTTRLPEQIQISGYIEGNRNLCTCNSGLQHCYFGVIDYKPKLAENLLQT